MTATRPLRVLHVIGTMNRGGVETWLMHVLRHTDPARCRHEFLVHSAKAGAYDDEIRSLGGKLFQLTSYRNPPLYAYQLRRHLGVHGPYDVVHSHVHHFSGLVLRTAFQAKVPRRIAHSHNDTMQVEAGAGRPRAAYLALMKRWIRRYATDRVAASRRAARALAGTDERLADWTVLHYGHDFSRFRHKSDPASVRAALGLPADSVVVGHVGRFDPQKNHAFLLGVLAELVRRNDRVRAVLVGDGPLRRSTEDAATALGLSPFITFAGVRPDVPELLTSAFDVFLFPSFHEGLPLACTEAQAAGLPLVISDSITKELDVVERLVTRLSLDDSQAVWAEACLAAAATRDDPGEALAALERSDFSISACIERLERLYGSPDAGPSPRQDFDPEAVLE